MLINKALKQWKRDGVKIPLFWKVSPNLMDLNLTEFDTVSLFLCGNSNREKGLDCSERGVKVKKLHILGTVEN